MTDEEQTVDSEKTEQSRIQNLLSSIAELGGKGMKEEDIVYNGNKLVLPERWRGSIGSAISYLKTKRDEEEESSTFSRSYNFRPWDGAYNAFQAMKKAFGMVSGKTTYSFFGVNRPKYIQVPISSTETEEVPWGEFEIPLLENTIINFATDSNKDYGQIFRLMITSPRKNRFIIEGLFKLVDQELKENSIYRGKAIDGQKTPQFIDLTGFDESRVVYSEQVTSDLDAHLWGVLRYSDANRKMGLPLKRALLLYGPYGTGKSLAGLRTAIEAVQAGWTFIMARPGRDLFSEVMQTARLYQPAVVFMEDVDTIADVNSNAEISKLLDLFDGIQAKNTDLMVVLTTNHPDSLHKGMLRPGRLDALIEIKELDAAGIEKLLRANLGNTISPDVDFKPIVEACKGYLPAFIKETADRAVRYSVARSKGDVEACIITTEDLVFSANGLRPQYERMQEAPEKPDSEKLSESLEHLVRTSAKQAVLELVSDDEIADSVWNVEEVDKARSATA